MVRCADNCVMRAKDGEIEDVGEYKIATCSSCGTIFTFNKLNQFLLMKE